MIFKEKLTQHNIDQCAKMTEALFEDLGLPLEKDQWSTFWHRTRLVEWPWALEWIDPDMKVFDVGTDPRFVIHLMHAGLEDVTMHHTSVDTENLGKLLVGPDWIDASKVFRKYERRLKMVWGFPEQLDIPDNTYDVVTNLSVMEHVGHVGDEDWLVWMKAFWRWLKPGGRLVMTCDYLVNQPEDGNTIDITNHPYWEFFSEVKHSFLSPATHVPWHPEYDPRKFVRDPEAGFAGHPANPKGLYSVYGFVVEKG